MNHKEHLSLPTAVTLIGLSIKTAFMPGCTPPDVRPQTVEAPGIVAKAGHVKDRCLSVIKNGERMNSPSVNKRAEQRLHTVTVAVEKYGDADQSGIQNGESCVCEEWDGGAECTASTVEKKQTQTTSASAESGDNEPNSTTDTETTESTVTRKTIDQHSIEVRTGSVAACDTTYDHERIGGLFPDTRIVPKTTCDGARLKEGKPTSDRDGNLRWEVSAPEIDARGNVTKQPTYLKDMETGSAVRNSVNRTIAEIRAAAAKRWTAEEAFRLKGLLSHQ